MVGRRINFGTVELSATLRAVATEISSEIVQKLLAAGIKQYDAKQFTEIQEYVWQSRRTTKYHGILQKPVYGSEKVMMKTLGAEYLFEDCSKEDMLKYKDTIVGYFETEIDVKLRAGDHPNILSISGFMVSYKDNPFPMLIFPFVEPGSLPRYITDNYERLDEKDRLVFMRDIALGLRHLHDLEPPIIHRTLTVTSIVLKRTSSRIVACITDVGSAKLVDLDNRIKNDPHYRAKIEYQAPEYIMPGMFFASYTNPTKEGDIWSFACVAVVMYQIIHHIWGYPSPWRGWDDDVLENLLRYEHPHRPGKTSVSVWRNLMLPCWEEKPEKRCTIDEIVTTLEHLHLEKSDQDQESTM